MCLNGTPLGSVPMQSSQLPQVTEFKYLGSTLQSDGDMSTEINKRTQCGWNNWRNMPGVLDATREYHHKKNWSEFSEGSIQQDHRHMAKKHPDTHLQG